jgi:hypothetical protein
MKIVYLGAGPGIDIRALVIPGAKMLALSQS